YVCVHFVFFFFSSRRRHTRSDRDWSSDVCSSDLGVTAIYDSGTAKDVWTKNAAGEMYKGEVWPGWCVFPDYTSPDVRAWWSGFRSEERRVGKEWRSRWVRWE